jgi:hypothetical protein
MILSKAYICRAFTLITVFFVTLVTLGGCSTAQYGQLKSNPDVTRSFKAYQFLPDHKYYYRGVSSRPIAIAGINKSYKLNLKLWVEIDPESDDFRILIDRVSFQGMGRTVEPWGFTILDKNGNVVGIWYSALRAAAVEIEDDGQIVQLNPMGQVAIGNQPQ